MLVKCHGIPLCDQREILNDLSIFRCAFRVGARGSVTELAVSDQDCKRIATCSSAQNVRGNRCVIPVLSAGRTKTFRACPPNRAGEGGMIMSDDDRKDLPPNPRDPRNDDRENPDPPVVPPTDPEPAPIKEPPAPEKPTGYTVGATP